MNIENLKLIQMLVADSNLSHAADRMGLSQSALSKRVVTIENELGMPLFERLGPRGLRPFPQTIELAKLSEKLSHSWEAGVRRIKTQHAEPSHFVLVGPPLFLREVVLPWWIQNEKNYPGLQLEVQVSSLNRVSIEALETGADAAILEHQEELPDYECRPVYDEQWGVVRNTQSPARPDSETIWGTYSIRTNPVDTWLVQTQKMPPPHYRFFWQDLTAIAIWVADTPGAASVLPWHVVAWLQKRKRLHFEPLGEQAKTRLFLAYSKKSAHLKIVQDLMNLSQIFKNHL